ncbi:MAG: DUF1028 domain-containing protein [Verrucomicrobiota bacterium]
MTTLCPRTISCVLLPLLSLFLSVGSRAGESPSFPPAATFSIVARDLETGELGIAVQSKIVAVGSIVPYGSPDGVVATQAWANVRFGPIGLALLGAGHSPQAILDLLLEADPGRDQRQCAILDKEGGIAVATGKGCSPWAGHLVRETFSVQGNLLEGPKVLEAMASAFERAEGVLAERLLASLRAGQEAGGDRRGKQSAALLIVRKGWGYGGGDHRARDLRVDDHPNPIEELTRVYELHRALFPRPITLPEKAE